MYITLAQAQQQLKDTHPENAADVLMKARIASGLIEDYLKSRADPLWVSEATTPLPVQGATLTLLTHLYENRGNDMAAGAAVWEEIRRMLERYRDPAIA